MASILRAHSLHLAFLVGTTLAALYIVFSPSPADNPFMNVLSGLLAAACAVCCVERLALKPSREATRVWIVTLILLTLLAFHEIIQETSGTGAQFDALDDLCLLGGGLLIASLLARFDPVPRLAANVFRAGFVVQLGSALVDCLDKFLTVRFAIDSASLQLLIDFLEFVGIGAYFVAAVLFLLSLNARHAAGSGAAQLSGVPATVSELLGWGAKRPAMDSEAAAYSTDLALPRTRLGMMVDAWVLRMPWPLAAFCAAQCLLWTAMPLVYTRSMHGSTGELVMWGRDFYVVNYKHPALVSWIMDAAFGAFGVHLWVLYLVGQVFIVATYAFVYLLGRELLDRPRAIMAPMLLAGLFYFGDFSTKFNHNLVQLPFWAGFAFFLWRASETGPGRSGARWWLLAAAMAALGLYGKFSTAMPIALGCAWIVADPRTRGQLRSWQPYAALALFLAMMAPLVYELWRTHFLTFTWITVESEEKGVSWLSYGQNQGEYLLRVVGVAVLAGAIGFRRAAPDAAPPQADRRKLRYLILMGAGPLLLTFVMAPFVELRTAWAMPMFSLMGLVLLGLWPRAVLRRVTLRAALAPLAVMVLMVADGAHDYVAEDQGAALPSQYTYPQAKIGRMFTKIWHHAVDRPLRIVGGDHFTAAMVGVYAEDRPSMFSELDPAISPAITPERIARDGMLIVWQDGFGWTPPPEWLAGREIRTKPVRWSQAPTAKPILFHYVIVPPRS